MRNNVTPHPRNPMLKAAAFYRRVMSMAKARNVTGIEAELVSAFMLASVMKAAGEHPEMQLAAAKRIHHEAVEMLELGMLVSNQEGNTEPPAA